MTPSIFNVSKYIHYIVSNVTLSIFKIVRTKIHDHIATNKNKKTEAVNSQLQRDGPTTSTRKPTLEALQQHHCTGNHMQQVVKGFTIKSSRRCCKIEDAPIVQWRCQWQQLRVLLSAFLVMVANLSLINITSCQLSGHRECSSLLNRQI